MDGSLSEDLMTTFPLNGSRVAGGGMREGGSKAGWFGLAVVQPVPPHHSCSSTLQPASRVASAQDQTPTETRIFLLIENFPTEN